MKLFVSLLSPYVRKVRMVIIEKGLSDRVELVESAPAKIKEGITKDESEEAVKEIEAAGGTAKVE